MVLVVEEDVLAGAAGVVGVGVAGVVGVGVAGVVGVGVVGVVGAGGVVAGLEEELLEVEDDLVGGGGAGCAGLVS